MINEFPYIWYPLPVRSFNQLLCDSAYNHNKAQTARWTVLAHPFPETSFVKKLFKPALSLEHG